MIKHLYNTVVFLLIGGGLAFAQMSPKDSILFVHLISPSISVHYPGGNMVDRFGTSGSLGGSFYVKTRKNWILGVDYGFLFGKNVKEQGIFDNLKTSAGFIINEFGLAANVDMFERGHTLFLKGGKVLPGLFGDYKFGPNDNCGLLLMGGVGYLQHRIHIVGDTPQLSEAYIKGYDRLTNGFAVSQFIGYLFLGNRRRLNFYFGFEFIQAWTTNKRGYNFDQMAEDTEQRLDVLSGFKVGWMLPLYKKVADEFYYN